MLVYVYAVSSFRVQGPCESCNHLSRSSAWTAFAIMVSNVFTSNVTAHADGCQLFMGLTADQLPLDVLYLSADTSSAVYIRPPIENKPKKGRSVVIGIKGAHVFETGSYLCIEQTDPSSSDPPTK